MRCDSAEPVVEFNKLFPLPFKSYPRTTLDVTARRAATACDPTRWSFVSSLSLLSFLADNPSAWRNMEYTVPVVGIESTAHDAELGPGETSFERQPTVSARPDVPTSVPDDFCIAEQNDEAKCHRAAARERNRRYASKQGVDLARQHRYAERASHLAAPRKRKPARKNRYAERHRGWNRPDKGWNFFSGGRHKPHEDGHARITQGMLANVIEQAGHVSAKAVLFPAQPPTPVSIEPIVPKSIRDNFCIAEQDDEAKYHRDKARERKRRYARKQAVHGKSSWQPAKPKRKNLYAERRRGWNRPDKGYDFSSGGRRKPREDGRVAQGILAKMIEQAGHISEKAIQTIQDLDWPAGEDGSVTQAMLGQDSTIVEAEEYLGDGCPSSSSDDEESTIVDAEQNLGDDFSPSSSDDEEDELPPGYRCF